jgi:hypothetical protein
MMRRFSLSLAAALLLAGVPLAAPAQPCSRETLTVRGVPVTIGYCITGDPVAAGAASVIPVAESFSAPGVAFTRQTTLRFISSEGPSRVIESADLAPLGLTGTLHLTLALAGGAIHIESALLTPGAVIVK